MRAAPPRANDANDSRRCVSARDNLLFRLLGSGMQPVRHRYSNSGPSSLYSPEAWEVKKKAPAISAPPALVTAHGFPGSPAPRRHEDVGRHSVLEPLPGQQAELSRVGQAVWTVHDQLVAAGFRHTNVLSGSGKERFAAEEDLGARHITDDLDLGQAFCQPDHILARQLMFFLPQGSTRPMSPRFFEAAVCTDEPAQIDLGDGEIVVKRWMLPTAAALAGIALLRPDIAARP